MNSISRTFQRFRVAVLYTTASLLIVSAIAVGVFRLAMEVLPEYRSEVALRLGNALNRPVRLDRMDLRWYGLGPEVSVEGLQLLTEDGKQVALNIGEARAGFTLASLWRILRGKRSERPRYILLKGLELTAERLADGRTRIRGFDNEAGTELAWDLALRWLFRPGRADVQNLKLVWVDQLQVNPAPVPFQLAAGSLSGDGNQQKLDITLGLPPEVGKSLRLHGLAVGSPEDWRVELVASIDGLLLERLPLPFRQAVPIIQDGTANLTFNFAAENYHVTDAAIDWDIQNMSLLANKVRLHWPLFEGRADWLATSSGWRLDVESAELQGEQPWNLGSARVEYSRQDDASSIMYLAASKLPVTEITRALQLLPFRNATMREWLQQSHLGGVIDEVNARLRWQSEQPYFERVEARISDIHWLPVKKMPGATHLSGKLGWNQSDSNSLGKGEFLFNQQMVTLDWPRLFRGKIAADLGGTKLQLIPEPTQTRLRIDNFQLENDDIAIAGIADLQLADDGGPAKLDLDLNVPRANVAATAKYLPVGIMQEKQKLVAWLDNAVETAVIEKGQLQYSGPLSKQALFSGEGNFQVDLDVSAVDFRFHDDWPLFRKAAGHIRFKDGGVTVQTHAGRLNGVTVPKANAKISDFRNAVVELSARGHSTIPKALDFLRTGPLKDKFADLMTDFTTSGKVQLELDQFKLPLQPGARPTIKGRALVKRAKLRQQGWPWPVEQVAGVLNFTEAGVPKSSFKGQLGGLPVQANLAANDGDGFRLDAKGPLPAAWLRQTLGLPNDWVSGSSAWQLAARKPKNAAKVQWNMQSDLRGFTFNLPKPLAKLPSQRRKFRIAPIETGSSNSNAISIRYGSEIAANLYWQQAQSRNWLFHKAAVAISRSAKQTQRLLQQSYAAQGIHIRAETEQLDAVGWAIATRELRQHWDSGGRPTLGGGSSASVALLLDAQVDKLMFADSWVAGSQLQLSNRGEGTLLTLAGPNAEGQISIQPDQPIRANLARLYLTRPPPVTGKEAADSAEQAESKKPISAPPSDFPGLVAVCSDCRVGSLSLGRVDANFSGSAEGVGIEKLQANGGGMVADITGEWTHSQYGPRSVVRAKLHTNQVDQVLKDLGYAQMLEADSVAITTSLNWPGGLQDFSLPVAGGELNLRLEDGRLFKVDPGAAKVFGLLSFNTLPRRLAMDFRDVVQPGMAFDRIEGDFRVDEGQARTRNLIIDGPAAKVQISGRTGLVSRDYDQIVQVSPKLGSSVTLAGTVLGGPGVGAALLVGQELFNKPFDKFSGLRYEVTGSWDDPEVNRARSEHEPNVMAGPRRRR